MTPAAIALLMGYAAVLYIGFEGGRFSMEKRTKKAEETSKKIAHAAAQILTNADGLIEQLRYTKKQVVCTIDWAIKEIQAAKRVAGSALTQAPDKKKAGENVK